MNAQAMTRVATLGYRRTQLLGFEGATIAQVAFISERGAPVALCTRAQAERADAPVTTTQMRAMAAAVWARGGYESLLIGGDDRGTIAEAAAYFAPRIASAPRDAR